MLHAPPAMSLSSAERSARRPRSTPSGRRLHPHSIPLLSGSRTSPVTTMTLSKPYIRAGPSDRHRLRLMQRTAEWTELPITERPVSTTRRRIRLPRRLSRKATPSSMFTGIGTSTRCSSRFMATPIRNRPGITTTTLKSTVSSTVNMQGCTGEGVPSERQTVIMGRSITGRFIRAAGTRVCIRSSRSLRFTARISEAISPSSVRTE